MTAEGQGSSGSAGSGGAGGEAITAEGLEALRAELQALEQDGRAEIARRISVAREMGDLKENAEYHIAKEDQGHLETKIQRLQQRLRSAVVVEASTDRGVVGFGATVHVTDEDTGREAAYTLVGPTEADLKQGRLSAESPMAQALMGATAGSTVEVQAPRGTRRLRIDRIG
jgi:transcription elongation factor GreA